MALEQVHRVLDAIPSLCIGLDGSDRVVQWNLAAEKVFGLPRPRVLGRTLSSLGLQWPSAEVKKAISRCRNQLAPIFLGRLRAIDRQRRKRLLDLTVDCIRKDTSGELLLAGRDVTQRTHLESRLLLAHKMESLGELASGIAHEINTPTQYVGDNTRFLRDSFDQLNHALVLFEQLFSDAKKGTISSTVLSRAEEAIADADLDYLRREIPKAIEESMEGLERVAKIVRAMKTFSHPDRDDKELANLNQAIESTVTVSRNEWKYVAEVELDLDPSLPPVPCTVGAVNQVVLNLIINASQAIEATGANESTAKGLIRISTGKVNGAVEIRVSDTGGGIAEEIRPKVFQPFFTTKEVGEGTGQGLALAYNIIVEKHSGSIDFESEVGRGTTFVVCLPLERTSH